MLLLLLLLFGRRLSPLLGDGGVRVVNGGGRRQNDSEPKPKSGKVESGHAPQALNCRCHDANDVVVVGGGGGGCVAIDGRRIVVVVVQSLREPKRGTTGFLLKQKIMKITNLFNGESYDQLKN